MNILVVLQIIIVKIGVRRSIRICWRRSSY